MANVTDPLVAQMSGSDPQNLMEYITRQKIYDSRYWKEECFGMTVVTVLERCAALTCLGTFPHTSSLALVLKLLQLHPEHHLVVTAFLRPHPSQQQQQQQQQSPQLQQSPQAQSPPQQSPYYTNKYARAVGSLYLRLTSRPAELYAALEPLYHSYAKLRVYQHQNGASSSSNAGAGWTVTTMDQWVHNLLTATTCLGVALPRLASRRTLQDAGYVPRGPRPLSVELELLAPNAVPMISAAVGGAVRNTHTTTDDDNTSSQSDPEATTTTTTTTTTTLHDQIERYLQFKATVEHCPAAMTAWAKRQERLVGPSSRRHETTPINDDQELHQQHQQPEPTTTTTTTGKQTKKDKSYQNLFKSKHASESATTISAAASASAAAADATPHERIHLDDPTTSSDAYWNEQRSKLGLKPLK